MYIYVEYIYIINIYIFKKDGFIALEDCMTEIKKTCRRNRT